MRKFLFVTLLSVMFCLGSGCCTVSVDQAYDSLKDYPYPFDAKIEECIKHNFSSWSKAEQIQFVVKIFPLTDAGSTYVLMEQADKHGLLPDLVEYAEKHDDTVLKQCCKGWMEKENQNNSLTKE